MFCKKKNELPELEIVYISNNLVVINKPYDIKINSNDGKEITVQTLLKKSFPSRANDKLYHEYYFPQRLDYSTSGVMCVPFTKKECCFISKALEQRAVKKYYIALVRGWFSEDYLDVNVPIGADNQSCFNTMCTLFDVNCTKPRDARTLFVVLEKGIYNDYAATKVLVRPFTGRRHQIRVHASHIGHTIIGDFTYSKKKDNKPPRMFLHSIRVIMPIAETTVIDVHTEDPFKNVSGWISVKNIHSSDIGGAAYSKLN